MRAVDVIIQKRNRSELSREEIEFFINGYNQGEIQDYQAAAFMMAVLLNGMTPRETTDLTLAMANSGTILDLSEIAPQAVDKHSTGGIGDKTTLVVEPVIAACGLKVGKMSGRGLGFTGGTLDKLESIPGYRTNLSTAEFMTQLQEYGLVLTGQSADLAPADGKLYALRDVTGTVDSIPLIASSIMSKKIAGGARAMVLDVKVGTGAFMQDIKQGKELATILVQIAYLAGRKAIALLSDMNQPLGFAVGNALEVKEAIETMQGGGPDDFKEHCLVLAGHLLVIGGKAADVIEGRHIANNAIMDGRAWEKFRQLVGAQGGDVRTIDNPALLPQAEMIVEVRAAQSGYLSEIHARKIGVAAMQLGAGRLKKTDPVDHSVGIVIHQKVGNWVASGQTLFAIHANDKILLDQACEDVLAAHSWSAAPVQPLPLFYGMVTNSGFTKI